MNSQMSLSHLDGYFLRLRLGKWEEGLGGTGYYVACITGMNIVIVIKSNLLYGTFLCFKVSSSFSILENDHGKISAVWVLKLLLYT